jgi:hypothetical protein
MWVPCQARHDVLSLRMEEKPFTYREQVHSYILNKQTRSDPPDCGLNTGTEYRNRI